jgi:hypothetical protein
MAAAERDDIANFAQAKQEKDELAAFLDDIKGATEPEWEAVVVPAWGDRTVWVRSLTLQERGRLQSEGFQQTKDADGQWVNRPTPDLEPLVVEMTCYAEIGGKKVRLFRTGADARSVLRKQRSGSTDELVKVAMRLAGFGEKAEEAAKNGSSATANDSYDSD